jgi:hypothetical protein
MVVAISCAATATLDSALLMMPEQQSWRWLCNACGLDSERPFQQELNSFRSWIRRKRKMMSASRLAPIFSVCLLGIIAFTLFARGRDNQTLEGVFVRNASLSEFYPGIKSCPVIGSSYWLVRSPEFDGYVSGTDIQSLLHSAWRVKLTGNLSRIGSFGFQGRYRREFRVSHVFYAEEIVPCEGIR